MAALGLSACAGGSTSGATSHRVQPASATLALTRTSPTRKYTVALSGRAETVPGAPRGRGVAIVAFHGQSMMCWRFAHLHGFTDATGAAILSGPSGTSGRGVLPLSTGPRLHHQGCVTIPPALTHAIWSQPSRYYVNVLSTRYPQGAVRAQL
jgi:hypothetical protein